MLPPDMKLPSDHEERMAVAKRFAQWHLGDPGWARSIMNAYLYPASTTQELDDEEQAS